MSAVNTTEPSSWGVAGTALWQGARDGFLLDTPETFYRAARTVGDMFGSDDIQSWATEGIDDIKRARVDDPFYKVDEDVMNSYLGRSIYGGISSVINNLTIGGAGFVGGMLTGGGFMLPMALYALNHGGVYGLAEYDNFIDDTYTAFKQINPELTWQEVQDQYNSEAVWSALAEGGLEAAGDLVLGELLSKGGKVVEGMVGGTMQKALRSQIGKTLSGILVKGPVAELPTELATQWIQTELRNSTGASNQSVGETLKEAFGSTYLSSMLLGGGGAIAEHAINKDSRNVEVDQHKRKLEAERNSQIETYRNNPVVQSLVADGTPDGMLAAISDQAVKAMTESGEDFTRSAPDAVMPPVNLNPDSAEFSESLNTSFEDIGFIPVPKVGQESSRKGKPISTVGEFYKIVTDFRAECEKDVEYNPEFKRWRIGRIRPEQARVLKDVTGFDFEDGVISFDTDFLKKMFKKHPEVTPEIFTMLPYTIANFTKVEGPYKSKRGGEPIVATISVFDGKQYRSVEVVPGKFKQMYLKSFHYRKVAQIKTDTYNKKSAPPHDGAKLGGSMQTDNGNLDPTSDNAPSPYLNNTTDSTVVNKYSEYGNKFVRYLKDEPQELTAREAAFFEQTKKKMSDDIADAHKLGVVNKGEMARFFDLLNTGAPKTQISPEQHQALVTTDLEILKGNVTVSESMLDKVNSSLLTEKMGEDDKRHAYIGAMAPVLENTKQRDAHTFKKLKERGVEAVRKGYADIKSLTQYNMAFADADTAFAAAGMLYEQAQRDVALASLEYGKTKSDADMADFLMKSELRNHLTEVISGMGTTAGRLLNQAKALKNMSRKELDNVINTLAQGKEKQQVAAMLAQLNTNFIELAVAKNKGKTTRLATIQEQLLQKMRNNDGQGLSDEDVTMLNELFADTDIFELTAQIETRTRYQRIRDMVVDSWISGMLTSPTTTLVNTLSGGANMAVDLCERLFAGSMYSRGSVLNGRADAGAMLKGMYLGFGDALFAAKRAFKTGQSQFGDQNEKGGLIDRGISKENLYMLAHGVKGQLTSEQIKALGGMQGLSRVIYDSFDMVGKVQKKLSSHTMLTSDEFLRTMAYSMYRQMYAERARKQAEAAGLDGVAAYQEIIDGKNIAIHDEIMGATRTMVFQDSISQDSPWSGLDHFRKKCPESMLIMPFLKTPLNIAKWVGTRTPGIANLFREYRETMSNDGDMSKKQLAEARMLTGSMIWHTGLLMAASGLITGAGPTDNKEKELLYNTGWRPNSLHIGDTYYEFTRMDPVATFFSTIASFVEIASDLDHAEASEVAAATMGAALQVISEKYYLSGVTDLLLLLRDSERYGESYVNRNISNLIPFSGIRRALTRGTDPIMREARELIDAVRKDTPLASYAAAARRNVLGEVVQYEGGALGRALSPVRTSTDKHDPVYDELYRLADNKTLTVGKPNRWFKNKKNSYKLSSQQYGRYLELAGTGVRIGGVNAKQRIQKLVKSPQYKILNDEQKAELIGKIIRTYRRKAKQALISGDSELTKFYMSNLQNTSRLAALL